MRWILCAVAFSCSFVLSGCFLQDIGRDVVRVEAFSPEGEASPGTNFTVQFSRDLVADSLLNSRRLDGPLAFEPALAGRFQWTAADEVRFYPDAPLAPSTQYRIRVTSDAARDAGYKLEGDTEFTVETPRVRVTSASLNLNFLPDRNDVAGLVGAVEFNYPVDPETAGRFISLQDAEGERVDYRLRTNEPATVMELEAPTVARSDAERAIELQVAEGLTPVGGNMGMLAAFVEPVLLPGQADLKVFNVRPMREAEDRGTVKARFNIPIRLEDAKEFIRVEPAVDYRLTSSNQTLSLRGPFKADETYRVTFKKGLRAIDGTTLAEAFGTSVTFLKEDIPPQIDFAGKGFYLTRSGNLNLGLTTINVEQVTVEVEQVFSNNLVALLNATTLTPGEQYWDPQTETYYYYNEYLSMNALGREIASFDLDLATVRNDEVVTPLNLEPYLDGKKGIFRVVTRERERRWRQATRWVVATDIGLAAKTSGDDLMIWAAGLGSLDAVAGLDLTLRSQNNQSLGTAQTGADGIAVFENVLKRDDGFIPFVVTAEQGDELAFLELTRRRLPTADFDVGGQSFLEAGYEAFLYDERGIYRPGDTVKLAGVVRGEGLGVPDRFPVLLQVSGPDGRLLDEQRGRLGAEGTVAFEIDVPGDARTGGYSAVLSAGDAEIGRQRFSVEEFIPDRMKVSVRTDKDRYNAGESVRIEVEGMTLFGPPAAGRRVSAQVAVEAFPFEPEQWRGYSFEDDTKAFTGQSFDLDPGTLDSEGRIQFDYTLPSSIDPPASLRAVVSATVLEPGGRGVTGYSGAVVHPHETYVGVRKQEEGYAEPGKPSAFQVVSVTPDGQARGGRTLEATLTHIYWHSILKQDGDRYRYVSEKVEETVAQRTVRTVRGEPATVNFTPDEYGRYRLSVRDTGSGATATASFYASGWGYAPWAMDTPERVEVDLDKASYAPGQRARVQLRAPFAGKVLLTVEREQVLHRELVTIEENTATVDLDVTEAYMPNAYVSALLVRSTADLERNQPARAFGVAPLTVDNSAKQLEIAIEAPSETRPEREIRVEFDVDGNDDRPFVTIAAVDEGILQLTDFQTPDPFAYFYGKKRLSVDTYDMHGAVLPEIAPALFSAAGDVETSRKRQLSPQTARRVKPVVFWSGFVEADRRGRGAVTIPVPEFNGTLRVMAAAVAGDQFGAAEQDVIVRDPVVLTPTFPRFLAPGDDVRLPISVFNGTGRPGRFSVELDIDGPVSFETLRQTVEVQPDREAVVVFEGEAGQALDDVQVRVRASGNGESTSSSVELPVRPAAPMLTQAGAGAVEAGETVSFTLPDGYLDGTTEFELVVAPFPAVRFAGSLQYLLDYPHGCIEQTTSKAFPLLAFNSLAQVAEPALFRQNSADYYIEEAIRKIERLQQPSGAFSYWPSAGYSNPWSSVYATHFLVEARKAGYAVTDRVYDQALGMLRSTARSYRGEEAYGYQTVAYAAYVLSLAGTPDRGTMSFLRETRRNALSAYSQYHLAGAYGLAGDTRTARTLLPETVSPTINRRETGGHFNSPVRSLAIMLDILATVDPSSPNVPVLVTRLMDQMGERERFATTQENAYAFLALGKVMQQQGPAAYEGAVRVAGREIGTIRPEERRFSNAGWGGEEVEIDVSGDGTAYYYWRADGIPVDQNTDEFDRDLRVRRRYLREDGTPYTDLRQIRQGDLVVAEITIEALGQPVQNVAVVDALPAGLEIENPRIASREQVSWLAGKNVYIPEYTDLRDDRMIVYGTAQRQRQTFYYGLRAVTAGTFALPPIRAEAMYDPRIASVASSGVVGVVAL